MEVVGDGISRMIGTEIELPPVTIKGVEKIYVIAKPKLNNWAVCEQHMLSMRKTHGDLAVEPCSKLIGMGHREEALQMMRDALKADQEQSMQRHIPIEEIEKWTRSIEGIYFMAKQLLEEKHPGISAEEAYEVFSQVGHQELLRRMDRASGTDQLGNSTGSTLSRDSNADPEPTREPRPNPSNGTGGESSSNSPKSTDGLPTKSDV